MSASDEARAFHESGHAIVFMTRGVGVRTCSVLPSAAGQTGGRVIPAIPMSQVEMSVLMLAMAAGPAAEAKLTGRPSELDSDDAEQMVTLAMALKNKAADSPEVEECLGRYRTLASGVVSAYWPQIERVAKRLLWKGSLTGEDIALVMEGKL